MTKPDLAPAALALADLVGAVRDDQLGDRTPCPEFTVEALLVHVHGLAQAFTAAAQKDLGPLTSTAPDATAQPLPADWRESTQLYLDGLGQAWRDASAWDGMTQAGGVDLPGEVVGLVALDEVVVHGWDLAVSTGVAFDPGDEAVSAVHGLLTQWRAGEVPPIFGPVAEVPESAPLFDRVVGLAGRDPGWSA